MQEPRTVLGEAEELVYNGPRQAAYGHPLRAYKHVADVWNATFGWDCTPEEAAMAMLLLKVVRETKRHSRDNCVDMAGYVAVYSRVVGEDE